MAMEYIEIRLSADDAEFSNGRRVILNDPDDNDDDSTGQPSTLKTGRV
jgi:hypothetical protein